MLLVNKRVELDTSRCDCVGPKSSADCGAKLVSKVPRGSWQRNGEAMTPECWWRVVFGTFGELRSCEAVEKTEQKESVDVFFVTASTRKEAESLGLKALRERERQCERLKIRRQRHKENGLCRCGSALQTGSTLCGKCKARNLVDKSRSREKRLGVVTPKRPKSEAIAETVRLRTDGARLETLLSVRVALRAARNSKEFYDWLDAEIKELESKKS